jgi:translation elongation factor EF-Tu-like GTPase
MLDKLFKINAEITVKKTGGRTWPIKSGYRPGFRFANNGLTSGAINLLDTHELNPGQKGKVEIRFISIEPLWNITLGTEFRFYEGPIEIGSGKVTGIIGWV